jgi:uncharacterized protein (TIGR02246 family)
VTRRRGRRTAFALAAFALSACAPSATVNQQSEVEAIRAMNREWMDAVAAHDIDRIEAIHTPDAVLYVSNMPVTAGVSARRKMNYDMLRMPGVNLTWVPGRIEVTSPTTATEVGTYTFAFDAPTGRVTDNGNYITLWRKVDGRWRVEREAVVSTTPLPVMDAVAMDAANMEMRDNASLIWSDLVAPGFAPGVKRAVIHGNPAGTGDYTLRLQFPANYQVPVHWHPKGEHVTVLSGTFNVATGNTREVSRLRPYRPGDFIYMPARTSHYASTQEPVTVQLHGIGPFQLNLGVAP